MAYVAVVRAFLRKVWEQHRERINTNPGYAAAVGAAAAAVVKLFTEDPAFLAVSAALTALYVAIHHATRRETWRRSSDSWEPSRSPWETGDRWDDGVTWRRPRSTQERTISPGIRRRLRHVQEENNMSKETIEHLNTNTLIGNTDARGTPGTTAPKHKATSPTTTPDHPGRRRPTTAVPLAGRVAPGRSASSVTRWTTRCANPRSDCSIPRPSTTADPPGPTGPPSIGGSPSGSTGTTDPGSAPQSVTCHRLSSNCYTGRLRSPPGAGGRLTTTRRRSRAVQ